MAQLLDLDAYRDEVAARESGGWGVFCMACSCGRRWVAVAPVCAGNSPMQCPGCWQMSGTPQPKDQWLHEPA